MGKKQSKKETVEQKQANRRAREAEQRAQAAKARHKKQMQRIFGIGGAVVIAVTGGCCLWFNTGSRALRSKVIAETEHYEVTAAMFACYFRQCADSYLRYAEQDDSASVFDTSVSLQEQEYGNGITWYDMFLDNTMSTVKQNLQYAEAAFADGYTLSAEDEANVQSITAEADLSRYQKGVRRSDLEAATRLTILADSYQKDAREKISVSDDEVNQCFQENPDKYLTASTLAYSFPWNPEGIITGDYTEHDAAVARAEELGACKTQQEFTEYVYRYLTEEKAEDRSNAEQIAANLMITDSIKTFPENVQNWINGSAKVGETLVWPREDYCYASVYMLLDEPAVDDSKTVDFRLIYLAAADHGGIDNAINTAKQIQEDVQKSDDPSAAFASCAGTYSADAQTKRNGGLVTGYSAVRTAYGDEIAAWAFDRERKQGDMTLVTRAESVMLVYFENTNDGTGWENQVYQDLYQDKLDDFSQRCTAKEVKEHEKNYKYIAPSARLHMTEKS